MSKRTKNYRACYWIFTVLSWLLVLGPLAYYSIYGFITAEVEKKATLGLTVIAAMLLTVISLVFKKHIRSTIFILLLGIYICIENILPLIIILSICTILDEFLITPLQGIFKSRLTINKELDKRLE